ncbi:MAG: hypothetical protein ACRC2K_05605 [Clostridium sp.]
MDNNLNYKLWLDKIYSVDLSVEILDLVIDENISIKEAIKKVAHKKQLEERCIMSVLPEAMMV